MRWESDEITKSLSRVVVSEGNSRVRADSFASGSHICVFRMAYAAFLFLSAAQANSTAILTARSSPSGRQRPDSTSRSTNRTAAPVRRPALCWRDCQPTWSRWQPVGLSRKSPIFGVLCLEYGAKRYIISCTPEIVNDYCVSALSPTGCWHWRPISTPLIATFADVVTPRRHPHLVQIAMETAIMTDIPAAFQDLLTEKKALAHLATIMPDGSPQVTPVWFDYTNGRIRVNTAKGRVKARNMADGSRVALSIVDPDNAYRYLQIRGKVAHLTDAGAIAHIDSLAKK